MTTVKTVPQILNDAADILEQENAWTKGEWHEKCEVDPSGVSHCADGALEFASGLVSNFQFDEDGFLRWDRSTDEEVYNAYERAYDAASEYTRDITTGYGIIRFNDADDRTQDEVVQALRGAAAAVRDGKISPRTGWEREAELEAQLVDA